MILPNFTIFGRSYVTAFPIQAEYQAVLDRATTLGYALPDSEQQRLDNNVVYNLKSLNLWTEIDVLYMFSRSSTQANFSKLNWKNPASFELTSLTMPAFTNNIGWVGGGGGYLNTNYTPSIHAVKALVGNVSVFFHQFGFTNAASAIWGCRNSSSNNFTQSNASCALHTGSIAGTGGYALNADILQVKNGTTHNKYINGVFNNSVTYTSAGTLATVPLTLLSQNLNGTISQFVTQSGLKYFGIGSKVLEAQQLNLYKIINHIY